MKIQITLNSNSKKNLNDTISDFIDIVGSNDILKSIYKAIHWTTFCLFRDGGTNTLFTLLKPVFENIAKGFFSDYSIIATPQNPVLTKKGEQLYVTVDVKDIDYNKSLQNNQQRIIIGLKKLPLDNIVWKILGVHKAERISKYSLLLSKISDNKKEAIIKKLIKLFNSIICRMLSGVLADNKIALGVTKIALA